MEKEKLLEAIEEILDKKMEDLKAYVDLKVNTQNIMINDLLNNAQIEIKADQSFNRKIGQFIEDLANLQKDFVGVIKDVDCIKSDVNVVRDYIIRIDKKIYDE